ncbi:hypothetical protein [Baia soyae]|uniref:Uncharacterized protein n=1 Tax=Baia soyae TaxID=1544746 RepID=A0A4R2RQM4_9BACL|nr:hypothetical protein [Baia soyae]TCP66440.1 hypothetical protein EDD57_12419 [Baia soyae]
MKVLKTVAEVVFNVWIGNERGEAFRDGNTPDNNEKDILEEK